MDDIWKITVLLGVAVILYYFRKAERPKVERRRDTSTMRTAISVRIGSGRSAASVEGDVIQM